MKVYFVFCVVLFLGAGGDVLARSESKFNYQQKQPSIESDTTKADSLRNLPYVPSRRPVHSPVYRFGDPFSHTTATSPLLLKDPSKLALDVEIDTSLNYTIYEKIGGLNYRPVSSMSFSEFNRFQDRQILKSYWKSRSAGLDGESAVSGRNIIPPIYVSPLLDRIFGGSYVEIIPRGFVTLDFGARWQRVDNPAIPIRRQRNGGFEFKQQISMNVTGKVGEKLKVTANFDNNNSFDLKNNLKVEYTGFKEDIIKKLEIGNISLPLNNSLISGAQNLFGVKAQMQFGKLFVTSVASTQRGKMQSVEVGGGGTGGQGRKFDIKASEYDENRHFFLGHFFRNQYEKWLQNIPQIYSGINIRRVEIYILNRQGNTKTLRNVVGLMDLGEPLRIYNKRIVATGVTSENDNAANNLYDLVKKTDQTEANIIESLKGLSLENGLDFEKMSGSRKLDKSEYTIHPLLGYISLDRKLQNDEALAVSYEYTYNGRNYQVGELSDDYAGTAENEVAFMKLLRPRKIHIKDAKNVVIPTWDLMMKNIYYLNASQIEQSGFDLRIIYRDDESGNGQPSLQDGTNTPIIELLGLDRLNSGNDRQKDGNFDFVKEITIDVKNGLVMFPFLEPFNTPLVAKFSGRSDEKFLRNKYVYDALYSTTRADAQQIAEKNKYFITGSMKSGSSSEIRLKGFNIAKGSVKVFSGGIALVEGQDYRVDYTFSKVKIINEGIINSGKKITVNYETSDLLNFQSRTLLGSRFDYKLNEGVNFGATLLYLNERPLITRIQAGREPARNLKYGLDVNIQKKSRMLTRLIDLMPVIQTKAPSSIKFSAEFAQLRPGTSNKVNGESTSYIDDFEASAKPYGLGKPSDWKLAATPQTTDNRFNGGRTDDKIKDLRIGYKRAKLAWYRVDNLFYRSGGSNNPNLSEDQLDNHYSRAVSQQEIFPFKNPGVGNRNEQIFDLAYFPKERGPYNYSPDLDASGMLLNPKENWAGITRAIRTEVDFDNSNIEYLEFWMMDPFISGEFGKIDDGINVPKNNTSGGKLIFNLGSISEDVIRDGRHAFENGIPSGDLSTGMENNVWGRVTTQQYLTNGFDNKGNRANQDVGLDGIKNEEEAAFYDSYVSGLSGTARDVVLKDVSADNFRYFLDFEQTDNIVERYKSFNGHDGNSPIADNSSFTPTGSTTPDNEDLNADNTLSVLEEYYQYQIDITPGGLQVGKNYIADQVIAENPNGRGQNVTWYLFRVPIRQPGAKFGNISGFKSIKYIRTILTGFEDPVVLRLANFRMTGSQWRRYLGSLEGGAGSEDKESDPNTLTISVVNIEENSQGNETQPPYVLPPGFQRDNDNTSLVNRSLNEQSLQLCVKNLEDNDARAVYKNHSLDLINYGRLKMFLHADSPNELKDGEISAFVRLGRDDLNYYEIEVPLRVTPPSTNTASEIWPLQNEVNIAFKELFKLKKERVETGGSFQIIYPRNQEKKVGHHLIKVLGNPVINNISRIMIGVRNVKSDDKRPLNACIWANEMRVTDFDSQAGWATNATFNAQLADLGSVTAAAKYTSVGFGSVQSKISERTREETTAYDIATNINLDKFLPEKAGLKIPMYVSYQKTNTKPKWNPGSTKDLTVEEALVLIRDPEKRNDYKLQVQDNTVRRSINFTNVKKVKTNPKAKKHIYDIENFSFTYAYSDEIRHSYSISQYLKQNYKAAVGYSFTPGYEGWKPFSKIQGLKSPYFKWIKDFNLNPIPNNISVRADLDRQFIKTVYRNREGAQPNFEKYFNFNRTYNVKWNITQVLSLDYSARAHAVIDEPKGEINTDEKKTVIWENLKNLGRLRKFSQNISANYKLPSDKLPFTDWFNADYRYTAGYKWTAGTYSPESSTTTDFGGTIDNNRSRALTCRFDLVRLYNKVKILKDTNTPSIKPRASNNAQAADTLKSINDYKFAKGFMRTLIMIRSVNATYSIDETTLLPGFSPTPFLFGMDNSFNAPGLPFVFGSQHADIRTDAASNGWIVKNTQLTTPFRQSRSVNLSIKASVEPFKDFKIQIDAVKRKTATYQEIYRFDEDKDPAINHGFGSLSPSRSGSYTISFFTLRTAFSKDDSDNNSPVFQDFENNRITILNRINHLNNNIFAYNINSQDVLIPAFIAAYSGVSADEVNLSPFPKTPVPNWRFDYSGLSKIPALKDIFSSVSITHSYKSSYTVSNYINSPEYENTNEIDFNNNVESYNVSNFASQGNNSKIYIPRYIIGQVLMSEQFAPLIGINLRTKGRATIKIGYKRQRNLSLQLTNNQVTEQRSNDLVLEYGLTKANFKLPFKSGGRIITLKNDLQIRISITIRDTKTVQRKLEKLSTVTSGNINFQIRPNINYTLNKKLRLQFYFEHTINEPKISTSFKRTTTSFGFQLRFNLAES